MNQYWETVLKESQLMRRKKEDLRGLVKELFAQGMNRKEIAVHLEIAEMTVDRAVNGRKQ